MIKKNLNITNVLLIILIILCAAILYNLLQYKDDSIKKSIAKYEENINKLYNLEEDINIALVESIPHNERLSILETGFILEKEEINDVAEYFNDFVLIFFSATSGALFARLASTKKEE